MEIHERIQLIIKTNNHTASSFADLVGVQRSSISHIMSGRNKPSLDFLQKTLKAFPKVDADWLITGIQKKQKLVEEVTDQSSRRETVIKEEEREIKQEQVGGKKSIEKIIVFYTDGTYEITLPSVR